MISKEETLQSIKILAEQKSITKNEINDAYEEGIKNIPNTELTKKVGFLQILNYIGGAIIFLGITIFLGQNWDELGLGIKLLTTLGVGLITYLAGLYFGNNKQYKIEEAPFYLISALVTPIGLYVLINNSGVSAGGYGWQSIIALISLVIYFLSYVVLRKNIFVLFSIIFSTWLFFSITNFIMDFESIYKLNLSLDEYRMMFVGLMYILVGYNFSKDEKASFSGFLYTFGIMGFLGTAYSMCGWGEYKSMFWELLFPVFAFGTLFFSVKLKSRGFLIMGTLAIIAYISRLTFEYFSSGLGWPLALVTSGLLMIASGYLFIKIKKKYLAS